MARQTSWGARANATAEVATATKAAQAGGRHVVSTVSASYSDPTSSGTLTITVTLDSTSTAFVHYVHGADVVPMELIVDVNTAVTAALASGGAGIVGQVNVFGETL